MLLPVAAPTALQLSSHPVSPKDAAVPCLWGSCDALETFTLTSPCPEGRCVGARRENLQEEHTAAWSCGCSEHSGHCCSPKELPAGEQQGWLSRAGDASRGCVCPGKQRWTEVGRRHS